MCRQLIAVVLLTSPALAQVDPKIHSLCIDAKDYAGCVKVQTSGGSPDSRVITQQGAPIVEGNSCPEGMAYIGGGTCQQVECGNNGGYGHNPLLGGKDWSCRGGNELMLGGSTARAYFDPKCPSITLIPGWKNTCNQQ